MSIKVDRTKLERLMPDFAIGNGWNFATFYFLVSMFIGLKVSLELFDISWQFRFNDGLWCAPIFAGWALVSLYAAICFRIKSPRFFWSPVSYLAYFAINFLISSGNRLQPVFDAEGVLYICFGMSYLVLNAIYLRSCLNRTGISIAVEEHQNPLH